ncbi:hypothetical protein FB472_1794 [Rhodoglobus vestalii]|uniref:DUF1648 domain-containing protein n=1 Tax=Rhodoglobus vestalii TaxID=193384 RepID=A0A8H2K7B6_9MICO|nr:hypothetical protein [Rhodoglobus vestalii]TQO20178.1 hypothetical protein FB472_1794 [Rhodoglobus vestalii]
MNTESSDRARVRDVIAALTLWVPLAVTVITWLFWREMLPSDLPRQWGSNGVSSTWPTGLAIVLVSLVCVGSAIISTFALRESAAYIRRKTFLWSGFAAGLACGVWLVTAGSTITSGTTAVPQVGAWPLLFMVLLAYGLIPFLIAHQWVEPEPTEPPVEVLFTPTETGAWISTVTVPIFAVVGVAMLSGGVALLVLASREQSTGGDLWGAAILLVLVVPMVAFARVRISVDWRGLKVVTWILGISLKTIPLVSVKSVHTEALKPEQWGGWGYRVMPGRSAIILRTGPGIVVDTTNGKQFALSLKTPETPAALLSTLSAPAR